MNSLQWLALSSWNQAFFFVLPFISHSKKLWDKTYAKEFYETRDKEFEACLSRNGTVTYQQNRIRTFQVHMWHVIQWPLLHILKYFCSLHMSGIQQQLSLLYPGVYSFVSVWGSKALNACFLWSFCTCVIVSTVHTGFLMSLAGSALPTTEAQNSLGRKKEHGFFLLSSPPLRWDLRMSLLETDFSLKGLFGHLH